VLLSPAKDTGKSKLIPSVETPSEQLGRRFWGHFQGSRAKITLMSRRINELEDALRISHALASQETHPLLSETLLGIKDIGQSLGDDTNTSTDPATALLGNQNRGSTNFPVAHSAESDVESLIPTLGNMFISCGGRSQYSGPSVWRHVRLSVLNVMAFG
jgi:hypothetical protein